MNIFIRKMRNLIFLFLIVAFFPSCDKLEQSYQPSWTLAPHQWKITQISENLLERMPKVDNKYYFYRGKYADYYFGKKGKELTENSAFKWWRFWLGLPPIRSITIDYDPVNKEIRGRIEPVHQKEAIIIWFIIWVIWQAIILIYALYKKYRSKVNSSDSETEAQDIYIKALKAIKNNEDKDYVVKLLQEVIEKEPNSEFSQYASAQINNIEYENNIK